MHADPATAPTPSAIATGVVARAAERADDIAVRDPHRTVTFAEFDALVGTMAARIADRPAEPWLPVFVDRTVAAAVAVHAAIRAGRPFAPIESRLPHDRIAELLGRLGNPRHAVLADAAMAALLPDGVQAVVPVDADTSGGPSLAPQPVDPALPGALVFTSGSTGRPKGVVRSWGALDQRLAQEAALPPGAPVRAVAQAHPFSFSAGLGHVSGVAAGNSLRLVDGSTISPEALIQWLLDNGITTLNVGGSLIRGILRAAGGRRLLPGVTTVGLGAEPFTWDIVGPIRSLVSPDATILVRFNATEVGEVMRCVIGAHEAVGTGPIPIGVAANSPRVRLASVDAAATDPTQHLHELIIRDPVAMYYLDDPELTAERFVTDDDGTRWWRSGDTVTIDAEGRYLHRGRVDDMVKINGVRIEPREAQDALVGIPGIGAACVLVHRTPSGKQRLIGHVRVDDDTLTPEAVRAQLAQRLPAHHVPAMLVRHDALPVTERGKVDRAALLAAPLEPWRVGPERRATYEPELWVAGQITRILDLAEVHADDDIWNAGMDSLGAVELCAVFAAAGLGEIDPTVLLRHRTPHAIERYLATSSRPANPSAVVELNHDGTATPIFAIPGGGGTSFAFHSLAQCLGADQPLVVIEPRGMHQRGPIDRTIDARAEHAIGEIVTRLGKDDPCVVLGYSAGATVAFEITRRLLADGRAAHLVLLDAVPRGRGRMSTDTDTDMPPSGVLDDGRRGPIDVSARLTGRSPLEHLRRIPRYWYQYRKLRRMQRLVRDPGPPGYSMERYYAFQRILRLATSQYDLQPIAVDATLIHVAGRTDSDACRSLVRSLDSHPVGGDHFTMLHPPHVQEMADVVAGVIRRVNDAAIGAKLTG